MFVKFQGLGPGRTQWSWARIPVGKDLPGSLQPGKLLTRPLGPAQEGGPHELCLYPSSANIHP